LSNGSPADARNPAPKGHRLERLAFARDGLPVLEFIACEAHYCLGETEAPLMPLTGPPLEGRTFFCPHCGALYVMTHSKLSTSESNIAKCVVCLQIMDSGDSPKVPVYKLIQRPDDA
jgi:hypothetical protein